MGENGKEEGLDFTPMKVLVGEEGEGKTYHATSVLFLKRDLDITAVPGWSLVTPPSGLVDVYEDDKVVGSANVYWGDYGDLLCDLFFDYASQARLTNQINDKIFAAPKIAINIDRFKKRAFIEVRRIDLVRTVPAVLQHTRIQAWVPKA
jgi:hypothetical protein